MYDLSNLASTYLMSAIADYSAQGYVTKSASDALAGLGVGYSIDHHADVISFYLGCDRGNYATKSYFFTHAKKSEIKDFDGYQEMLRSAFVDGVIMMMTPCPAGRM